MEAEKFWMVYVESANEPVVHHPTFEVAKGEAERLAKLPNLQGRKVFVLEVVACCVYNAVNWLPLTADGIPF